MKPNYEDLKLSTSVVLFFGIISFLLDLLELKFRSEKVILLYSTANQNNNSGLRRAFTIWWIIIVGVFLSEFYSMFYLDVRGCNVQAGDEGMMGRAFLVTEDRLDKGRSSETSSALRHTSTLQPLKL